MYTYACTTYSILRVLTDRELLDNPTVQCVVEYHYTQINQSPRFQARPHTSSPLYIVVNKLTRLSLMTHCQPRPTLVFRWHIKPTSPRMPPALNQTARENSAEPYRQRFYPIHLNVQLGQFRFGQLWGMQLGDARRYSKS